jgi:hypothetical protein
MSEIRIPTPEAFVAYVNELGTQMKALRTENETLKRELNFEKNEASRLRHVELLKCVEEIKTSTMVAVVGVHAKLEELEADLSKALSDPRLNELDRKLLHLGRVLKRNEGVDRVVMELETENAFLHNELELMSASIRELMISEVECKTINEGSFEVNRCLEQKIKLLEGVIAGLQEERKRSDGELAVWGPSSECKLLYLYLRLCIFILSNGFKTGHRRNRENV